MIIKVRIVRDGEGIIRNCSIHTTSCRSKRVGDIITNMRTLGAKIEIINRILRPFVLLLLCFMMRISLPLGRFFIMYKCVFIA